MSVLVSRSLDIEDLDILLVFLVVDGEVEVGLALHFLEGVVGEGSGILLSDLLLEAKPFKFMLYQLVDLVLHKLHMRVIIVLNFSKRSKDSPLIFNVGEYFHPLHLMLVILLLLFEPGP